MATTIPFPEKAPAAARFERLLRPQLARMYRLAWHLTGSQPGAEALIREICIQLAPRLDEMQEQQALGLCLARMVYSRYLEQHRDQAGSHPERDTEPGPDELADSQLQPEQLLQALSRLPGEQRALIAWHDIEGYSLEALSGREGPPVGTLRSRLCHARAQLRALLAGSLPRVIRAGE